MRSVNEILGAPARKRSKSCPKISNYNVEDVPKAYNNYVGAKRFKKDLEIPTWSHNLRNYFSEYCNCSGMHGVRYLSERGRFMIEKLTWCIAITLVGYFCISLIAKAYNKWVTSPVMVTFATTETAISSIPFPAITICPEVKSDPEIFNFTDVFLRKAFRKPITADENQYYESLSLICSDLDRMFPELEIFGNVNLTVSERAMDDLANILPFMDPDNTHVHWLTDVYDLNSTLSYTFTSEGICYSFNMLDVDDILLDPEDYVRKGSITATTSKMWTLEEGYSHGAKMDTYPMRTFKSGISGGFESNIFTNHSHLDYFCSDALQGFKVTLHHPFELPNMDRHFRLPLDQVVLVAIKPRMIIASEELKAYKAKDRQCYFATERSLKFYSSYTQQNCLAECLSNYTLMECGCVAFYMPKLKASLICGPGSKECLRNSTVNYLLDKADFETNTAKSSHQSGCNCLPSCTSLEYDVEISQSDWNSTETFDIFSRVLGNKSPTSDFDYTMAHYSKLAVYYREMQFLSSERHEVYGYLDFFSNTGGLLGLFIGFSVTSVIEILYFLTLRLACNIKKFGRDFWSGQQNITHK